MGVSDGLFRQARRVQQVGVPEKGIWELVRSAAVTNFCTGSGCPLIAECGERSFEVVFVGPTALVIPVLKCVISIV